MHHLLPANAFSFEKFRKLSLLKEIKKDDKNLGSFSEPNAYAPVIVSTYKNSRDIPLFKGKIREDETTVRLDPPLSAYDNDTVGSASKITLDFLLT